MLEGLSGIEWSAVHHAYGPATDVPGLLRAMLSDDVRERTRAARELHNNLGHQGSRYPATAAAIPFLVEIATSPWCPERHERIWMLASLAMGLSELDVFPETMTAEHLAEFDTPSRAAYDAVLRAVPALRDMMPGASQPVIASLAYLLAWFPTEAAASVDALVTALADTDVAAANCTVALALLNGVGGTAWQPDMASLLSQDQVLRWATAFAVVLRDRQSPEPAALGVLLRAIETDDAVDADIRMLFGLGSTATLSVQTMRWLGAEICDQAIDRLLPRITPDRREGFMATQHILRLAEAHQGRPRTPTQREALRKLKAMGRIGYVSGDDESADRFLIYG